jgi:hypothetical protein
MRIFLVEICLQMNAWSACAELGAMKGFLCGFVFVSLETESVSVSTKKFARQSD